MKDHPNFYAIIPTMINHLKDRYFRLMGWLGFSFTCKHCQHTLPANYQMRTPGYCFLDDPNVSLQELLDYKPRYKADNRDAQHTILTIQDLPDEEDLPF